MHRLVQVRDKWGFQMTGRHNMYAQLLSQYCTPDFKPQVKRNRVQSA